MGSSERHSGSHHTGICIISGSSFTQSVTHSHPAHEHQMSDTVCRCPGISSSWVLPGFPKGSIREEEHEGFLRVVRQLIHLEDWRQEGWATTRVLVTLKPRALSSEKGARVCRQEAGALWAPREGHEPHLFIRDALDCWNQTCACPLFPCWA